MTAAPAARPDDRPALRLLDREVLEAVADAHHRGLRTVSATGIAGDVLDYGANGPPPSILGAIARLRSGGLLAEGPPHGRSRRFLMTGAAWEAIDRRPPVDRARDRSCLGCRRTFRSDGPHNRLCPACLQRAERASGAML